MDMRKGPWTQEEDSELRNCVTIHGEGHWTSLARSAGLNRSGKSCRLRWLNYLKPNVRRGNLTLQEQLLIIQLNLRIGNRWSQIAKYLPGRTDNEIKNYWRTKVKKQAKQLKCDVTSQKFRHTLRYLWMPRLVEQIHLATVSSSQSSTAQPITTGDHSTTVTTGQLPLAELLNAPFDPPTNHEAPATEMFDSMVATNCYASMRSNSSSNSVPYGIDCGLESAAAANSFASGEGQATEESETLLLSGEDWSDIFPDHQYDDIWDLPQMLYDEVYLN